MTATNSRRKRERENRASAGGEGEAEDDAAAGDPAGGTTPTPTPTPPPAPLKPAPPLEAFVAMPTISARPEGLADQARPVEPKPPLARLLAANESTTRNAARTTGTITSWAMRSNGSIVNGPVPRFQQLTISGPW